MSDAPAAKAPVFRPLFRANFIASYAALAVFLPFAISYVRGESPPPAVWIGVFVAWLAAPLYMAILLATAPVFALIEGGSIQPIYFAGVLVYAVLFVLVFRRMRANWRRGLPQP